MGPAPDPRRRAAARLFARGLTRAETARRLGLSRATASRWYRLWEAGGDGGLCKRRPAGRPPKLGAQDLEHVQRALAASPRHVGFPLDRWSLAAVAALIERDTGVAYHPRHVARVLQRSGWVVPPVGEYAALAFRQLRQIDPDGNPFFIRHIVER